MIKSMGIFGVILFSMLSYTQAAEISQSFSIHGEAINPVCIQKMRPRMSDQGIIVKSIVLEECQKSNWGFHKNPIDIKENMISTNVEDETFGYQLIGKTSSGLFIAYHTGNEIVAYRIDEQTVQPDLLKPETKKVHILTAVSESFIPCYKHAEVKGDRLIIEKQRYDPEASHANQCTDKTERIEYELKP